MGKLLFLLFTLVPLLELWLLVRLGGQLGALPTLALVVATGAVGAALAKREGRRVWGGWQRALAEGRLPEEGLLSGALVLAGGVLLVAPGVLTDVAGLLLLFPPTRRVAARGLRRRLERGMQSGHLRVVSLGGFGGGRAPGWGAPPPEPAPRAEREWPPRRSGPGAPEEAQVVEEADAPGPRRPR